MYSPSNEGTPPSNGSAFVQTTPEYIQGPPRKKMRKGTKSCLECRRRKIKCTFEPNRPAVCNECYARGSTCIDQEHGELLQNGTTPAPGEQSYSLRERVTQLEGLVREVLNRLPENNAKSPVPAPAPAPAPATTNTTKPITVQATIAPSSNGETQAAAEALKNLKTSVAGNSVAIESGLLLPGGRHEDAPLLTLFDNAVIKRKQDTPSITAHQHNKSRRLIKELHDLLPSPQDIDLILDAASMWWSLWRQIFPLISDPRCDTFKQSVSHSLRSDKAPEIAKVVLCIAVSLNQTPLDFEKKLNLPCPARDFVEHCVNTIDQLITSDDELGATVEGIECMLMEAKFHINLGRPRRAWILYRRAIGFAQLLGLHRIGNRLRDDDNSLRREQWVWTHLFQGDRYLSLILGLPYAVPERFCTIRIPSDTSGLRAGELYLLRLSPLIGKIVDRNQEPERMTFATTLRIDAELNDLASSMPQSWWQADRQSCPSTEECYDQISTQFFHHQLRLLLHLPFMLKSSLDRRYHYSHQVALESSRKMIRCFSIIREDSMIGPYMCKLVDFQAFTAAMLLVVNLMDYSRNTRSSGESPNQTPASDVQEQDAQDHALVDETIRCLQRASKEPGGIVAVQSAKALELLLKARENKCEECDMSTTCKISIPCFGTITIGAGSRYGACQAPSKSANPATVSGGGTQHSQLPTPPASTATHPTASINGSNSTQVSPESAATSSFPATTLGVPASDDSQRMFGADGDEALISFDNFMGLPQTDFIPFQSSTNMNGVYGSTGMPNSLDPTHAGNFGSWAYPNWGTLDLDQGWNWTGDGTLAAEWNTGVNNAF